MCSLFLGFENLLLEGVGLGEADLNLMGSQLEVDGLHGVKLALNLLFVKGVKEDSHVLFTIKSNSG
jgi:hypothetical protein